MGLLTASARDGSLLQRYIHGPNLEARMGVRSLRAVCPNCGGKIHTQPKGLGHFTWANSWFLAKTGTQCQHCGVPLSGKIAASGKAIAAADVDKPWHQRQ